MCGKKFGSIMSLSTAKKRYCKKNHKSSIFRKKRGDYQSKSLLSVVVTIISGIPPKNRVTIFQLFPKNDFLGEKGTHFATKNEFLRISLRFRQSVEDQISGLRWNSSLRLPESERKLVVDDDWRLSPKNG